MLNNIPYSIKRFLCILLVATVVLILLVNAIFIHYEKAINDNLKEFFNKQGIDSNDYVKHKQIYDMQIESSRNKTILIIIIFCVITSIVPVAYFYIQKKQYDKVFTELCIITENISSGRYKYIKNSYNEGKYAVLISQINNMQRSIEGTLEVLKKEKSQVKDFIANISHQLKTPIAVLSLYQELIYEENKGNSTAEKAEICLTQINRMKWLVNTLLKIAKFDSFTINLNYKSTPIINTIKHGVNLGLDYNPNKKVRITYDGDLSIVVNHDLTWFAEAIENIIKNSLNYIPSNGHIKISLNQADAIVIIKIEDNGGGFSDCDIPHLFNRFYTVNKKINKLNGIGIGLALVKAIVEAHKGSIKASNGDDGAIFTIIVPKIR